MADELPRVPSAPAALRSAVVDVVLSLLLGVLLVRDTTMFPTSGRGWLVAGAMLAPGVAQRLWVGWRISGDAPDRRELWVKVGALAVTLAVARVAVSQGVAPTLASGAIAMRLIVLTAHRQMRGVWFVGGAVAGLVFAVGALGATDGHQHTLLSGSEPSVATSVRDLVALGAVVVVFAVIGDQTRRQRDEQLRIEQALAAERTRIARELHDVVSHQMTGVVLQAQGAAAVLDSDRRRALAALRSIEEGSRAALVEMRRLLGVLREGEEMAGAPMMDVGRGAPQPTLDDIAALVQHYTRSTSSPDDDDDGDDVFDPGELLSRSLADPSKRTIVRMDLAEGAATAPAGVQASAHRIVQEAFTNIARHVGRASVDVRVRVVGDDLVIRVVNGPSVAPPTAAVSGAGLGLRGMRERAESLGGTFEAGPTGDGGWEVRASLPLDRTAGVAAVEQTPSP